MVLSDDFAAVLGGFLVTQDETQAARDRQAQQARAEIARAVQDGANVLPVGGLHRSGLKIRDPKASG
jgi:preprotein translocase subunit YajC